MFHFNLSLLKSHPYATGGIVIVGGVIVYYFISRGSSGTQTSAQVGDANVAAEDTSLQQTQAAAAVQTNAQNAAIQQAQIAASSQDYQTSAAEDVSNTQTLAALVAALSGNQTTLQVTQSNNDAATLQQANQETANQNIEAIQESGIEDQINQAYNISANTNATNLAGLQDTLSAQQNVDLATISSATSLASQQQAAYDTEIPYIVQNAGDQKNSALDATDQTSIFQTILSGGNAGVAAAGTAASSTANVAGEAQTGSILGQISKLGTAIGAGLVG
jgi:hypothetical protein